MVLGSSCKGKLFPELLTYSISNTIEPSSNFSLNVPDLQPTKIKTIHKATQYLENNFVTLLKQGWDKEDIILTDRCLCKVMIITACLSVYIKYSDSCKSKKYSCYLLFCRSVLVINFTKRLIFDLNDAL